MAKRFKCILDSENIVTGYEEVDEADVTPADVALDHRPDLPPGQYRWNGERFEPASIGIWFTPHGPDSWFAVYRALDALQTQGVIDFPEPVKVWLRYYKRSFDRPAPPPQQP